MPENIFKELSACPQVEAIALGGSRAENHFDETSDYDVYIYITSPVPEQIRRDILSKYCSFMEIGNHYWEDEDNCTLNSGCDIDLIYRNMEDFKKEISSVVDDFIPHNGYTTCMWHNLKHSKILFDRNGKFAQFQKQYMIPYPKELKKNIIERNMNLLDGYLPSYSHQIKKMVQRKDLVGINHRVTEFLASYFDVLFALNEQTHPGEKRLMEFCKENCSILPQNFEDNITLLFSNMLLKEKTADFTVKQIDLIVDELRKII